MKRKKKEVLLVNQRNEEGHKIGKWVEHYPNGKLKYKATYIKKGIGVVVCGLYEFYFEDGELFHKGRVNDKSVYVGYWEEVLFPSAKNKK